ncbi:MAG: hypothetical protein RLY16_66 [Bacteroidota bacterium]|jgi:hypothetical protein
MFKKDNFIFGLVLGLLAPLVGLLIYKYTTLRVFSFNEAFSYMLHEPGFKTLSVGLSLSLMLNAVLFTVYINRNKDYTAKGIFTTTFIYGLIVLSIKTFL